MGVRCDRGRPSSTEALIAMTAPNPNPSSTTRAAVVPADGQELLHHTVPLLVELATAAQVFSIHRRIAADTGLLGLDDSRDRLRDACEDVVRRMQAAHAVLALDPVLWARGVNATSERLADQATGGTDEALQTLPAAVAQALADALDEYDARDRGPALTTVAGTAMALWIVAGADVAG